MQSIQNMQPSRASMHCKQNMYADRHKCRDVVREERRKRSGTGSAQNVRVGSYGRLEKATPDVVGSIVEERLSAECRIRTPSSADGEPPRSKSSSGFWSVAVV